LLFLLIPNCNANMPTNVWDSSISQASSTCSVSVSEWPPQTSATFWMEASWISEF
jgi:hypothetical protein